MKKQLLITLAAAMSTCAFAQSGRTHMNAGSKVFALPVKPAMKTTAAGDTLVLSNISSNDTLNILTYNVGGYTSGNNGYGDKGFAERYDFNPNDSLLKVLGVVTYFTGNYSPNTTNTVNLKAYAQGAPAKFGGQIYNGFPGATLAQRSVSIKNLGINASGNDTIKAFFFPAPTAALADSFFVGYEINYNSANLAGDTIGLVYTNDGNRDSWTVQVMGTDTIINVQNAVMFSDGDWYDEYWDNNGMVHDFYILPIVEVNNVITSVPGITRNNLEFFGAFPNPAGNRTNIKIGLKKNASVTVMIMDMNGRVISSSSQSLPEGQHELPVDLTTLASGSYIYSVRTSEGDGIASVLNVSK